MPLQIIILGLLLPLALLAIGVVKSYAAWQGRLRRLSGVGRIAVLALVVASVAFGGGKGPGPTISGLKLLLAERGGKLSNGQAYGPKSAVVLAQASTTEAQGIVQGVTGDLPTIAASLETSTTEITNAVVAERHYLRLVFPRPELTEASNLYGEIMRMTVTNGVATAFVWFNVVPNAEPQMFFSFALDTATNRLATVSYTSSSFPDTVEVGGFDCYQFAFPVPAELLSNGLLYAPLDYEKRIALGCPEMDEPFNVAGGLAFHYDNQYWVGVTGWRTNTVSGIGYYFSNGMLAVPPEMETHENEE
jgi:hypothetical protein